MIQVYTCITDNKTLGFIVRIDEQVLSIANPSKKSRFRWNRFAYSRTAMLEKIRISWEQLISNIGEPAASEVFQRVDSVSDRFTSYQRLEAHFIRGKIAFVWIVN